MNAQDFELFQTLLKQRSGLVVTRDKAYLLESRLMPVARKHGKNGLEELAGLVRSKRDEGVLRDITEAMTTNESSFFRDQRPFDQFRQEILPNLLKTRAGAKRLRIWSAACSYGQEAYSLAMILKEEQAKLAGWSVDIVGTDISNEVLNRAKAGAFTQFEVQRGLPITLLVKYFAQQGDKWVLKPEVRNMVSFRFLNLLEPLTGLGNFDVVFCRNVLIYFDQPTKAKVLEAIAKIMQPDGVLFLGGAETVLGITSRFKPLEGQRGIYALT